MCVALGQLFEPRSLLIKRISIKRQTHETARQEHTSLAAARPTMAAAVPTLVEAKFDFEASNRTELKLTKGTKYRVVNKVDDNW